jgi:hypothetical protein
MESIATSGRHEPWNKGKIVGQKAPFKLKEIGALRVRLQMENRVRELALFNLGIDSKLRGCDLVSLRVRDICHGEQVASRAIVMQHKTQRPVQFEITPATREVIQKWIKQAGLKSEDFLFPSRIHESPHLGTRQYARILGGWGEELGLEMAGRRCILPPPAPGGASPIPARSRLPSTDRARRAIRHCLVGSGNHKRGSSHSRAFGSRGLARTANKVLVLYDQ